MEQPILSKRALAALRNNEIDPSDKEAIRRLGKPAFLRTPGAGDEAADEVGRYIGGWIDQSLPDWASPLSTRARGVLVNAFNRDPRSRLPDAEWWESSCRWLTKEAVREKGREWLKNANNCGAVTLSEIEKAIGGWGDEVEADSPSRAMIAAAGRVLRNYVPSQDMDRVATEVWQAMRSAAKR